MTPPRPAADRSYGRRLGRPLRQGQQVLLDQVLPALQIPAGGGPIDLDHLFGAPVARIWLEIGFGGGEHLAAQVAEHPDVGLIGAEPFLNGVASALALVPEAARPRTRLWPAPVADLLDRLPDGRLDRVFLLFPDPWPKLRHHKRRFVQPRNLDRLARLMADGAELRMATDDADYMHQMLAATVAHPAFAWTARRPDDWRRRTDDWPETRYERKALKKGLRPTYLRFMRRPRSR